LGLSRIVIDATAEERVRRRLSKLNQNDRRHVIRVEIYDRGRLGVQFCTGPSGNPDLVDLYYFLLLQAVDNRRLSRWLLDQHSSGPEAEELLFGFGCASMTTRMPNLVIAQHAAAFMPSIVSALAGEVLPGVSINSLDANFRPEGWTHYSAPEFAHHECEGAPEWSVRLLPEAGNAMAAMRSQHFPVETGGYLYGGWDAALKRIVVVTASPIPPNSRQSESLLDLGPSGATDIERRLASRTQRRIGLCGTWHSHPGSSAAMSLIDNATVQRFYEMDRAVGVPTLLFIVADDTLQCHLGI
jgi:proteasome lid subunit RPN8/RPN11